MMDNDCQTAPFIDEGIRISVYNLDDYENDSPKAKKSSQQ